MKNARQELAGRAESPSRVCTVMATTSQRRKTRSREAAEHTFGDDGGSVLVLAHNAVTFVADLVRVDFDAHLPDERSVIDSSEASEGFEKEA